MVLTLASWVTGILTVLFVFVCVLMALVILIQKPKGGGLAGAFGGAGSSGAAVFGAKTGDVLTWVTIGCFVAFILLAILLVRSIRDDAHAGPTIPGLEPAPMTAPAIPDAPIPSAPEPVAPTPAPAPAPQQ